MRAGIPRETGIEALYVGVLIGHRFSSYGARPSWPVSFDASAYLPQYLHAFVTNTLPIAVDRSLGTLESFRYLVDGQSLLFQLEYLQLPFIENPKKDCCSCFETRASSGEGILV